jgi:hypothetical protein
VIVISTLEDLLSPSVTVRDNLPASFIVSHDLTSLLFILSDTVQFSVLSSLRDAISSSHNRSLLPEILTFTHQKIFICDCFTLISGALFVIFNLISALEDFHSPSVTVSTRVPSSFNVSHDLTSFPFTDRETLQS